MDQTNTGHRFHPTILREYDVRGIVGETLFPEDARALGRAFGTIVREAGGTRVAVGYDGRLSSPEFETQVVQGLVETGITVVRTGRGPTPMLYYAVFALGVDGGIQITGSHNPPTHNGFKMMLGKASFFGDAIKRLGAIAASGAYAKGEGRVHEDPIFERYIDRLVEDIVLKRPLKVVWDAGNGAAGPAMAAVSERLSGTHSLLYADIDGRFPNHHPDPTEPHNLVDLRAKIAETGADLGIAFDGDGDRIGVVDDQGRILWGDQLVALLARPILAERPGSTIIADVKASQGLFDEIARLGGNPLMWRTGHSLIKAKLKETGAPLAGEMSGHIFLADRWYGFDDALYVALRFLELVAAQDQPVSALRDALPQAVNTPELRFACEDTRKFAVIEEVRARLAAEGAEVNDVDGVRVKTADGWWLLRASNTQAVLVARCEARDAAGLERLKQALRQALAPSGVTPPDLDAPAH